MTERTAPRFWVCLVLGTAAMAYGVAGLVHTASLSVAARVGVWIVGSDLAHDLVLAPVVCVAGYLVATRIRGISRAPVLAGLLASGVLLGVAYPVLRGFGRATAPGNDSVLPLDYPTAAATVLGVVWGLVLVWITIACVRRRTRPDPVTPPAPYSRG